MKLLLALFFAISTAAHASEPRSPAKPIVLPGLENFYQVSPTLFRAKQPTAEGFRSAQARGVKTVIDLRAFHSDADLVRGTKLKLERIPFKTWHPETEDVVRFLRIATSREAQPVLVHCQHGSDRTGMMVAIYRIVVQRWSKPEAIDEMTKGGFGFHPMWKNLVAYIEKLDVAELRKRVALSK